MRIILIGIPGAGKSTQGNLLSKQLKLPYLSTGHIFRILSKEKSPLGRYVKEMLHSGQLIPDEKTLPIVEKYLSGKAYKRGYILDGFPRTVTQAKHFKGKIDKVIYITLDDKDALWRIAYRTEQRDDQAAATIINRINVFHESTDPVVEYYSEQDLLETVEGTGTVEEVNEAILRTLGKTHIDRILKPWEQRGNIIFAITGLSGSGKSHVSDYLRDEKEVPVIHFGKIVTDEVAARKQDHTEENHKLVRNEFRQKHGMGAMAELSKESIEKAFKKSPMVAIDDMHSYEEYTYLQKHFPKAKICLVAVWADKESRYKRIQERSERNKLGGIDRDINEVIDTNMGPTIALADYILENNGSIEDLNHKVEHMYREVYFDIESDL